MVRTSALRRAFVSVKGFYFQADVLGQPVTWLVPHALAQVLPAAGRAACIWACMPGAKWVTQWWQDSTSGSWPCLCWEVLPRLHAALQGRARAA